MPYQKIFNTFVENKLRCNIFFVKIEAQLKLPLLSTAELYGSKLAALDRQTSRDLFDVVATIDTFYSKFVGMTAEAVDLTALTETRSLIRLEIPMRLTENHKRFLIGLTRMTPDWSLLKCPYVLNCLHSNGN